MRKWFIRLALLVALVAAAVFLWRTLVSPDPIQVRVYPVDRGTVEETITNSRAGTVRARRRAKLSPEIGGQVVEIPFREGDSVRSGDAVLVLDARSQKANLRLRERELDAANAEENRARVAAERSERELARFRRLAEDQIVSVDLLDQAESSHATAAAAHDSARAQTARARAAVALTAVESTKTILHAPFDGVLAEITVEVGEWATPSPPAMPIPAVVDILDPTSIYITAPVDEVDSTRVRAGMPVRITVDSHRDRKIDGAVSRVAPYVQDVQDQNRTVEVEAKINDPDFASTLLPGTSADLEIIAHAKQGTLRVPTTALLEGGRAFVLEEGVLRERQLETGIRNWNFTEVLSGLVEGDLVVVSLDQAGIEEGVDAERIDTRAEIAP